MATDLFGKPLGKPPEYTLSLAQKRQAALLYHWMSLDYLKGLLAMIDALIQGADVTLALAKVQGRDELIVNARWGVRDTAANWSTWGHSALDDFKRSTIKLIGWRNTDLYCGTGAMQCSRMLSEHSSMWMTPDEQQRFEEASEQVFHYAYLTDQAAGVGTRRPIRDCDMFDGWQEHAQLFTRLPRFRVLTDVQAETGQRPTRTGVYVPQDDPLGTLQFAWTGGAEGALGSAVTFNALGLRAVNAIGRNNLWNKSRLMADFVGALFDSGELSDRKGFKPGAEHDPERAGVVFSDHCFTERPCKWYFVERIDGEYEDNEPVLAESTSGVGGALRCEAHQPCPRTGWWLTPSKSDSRRLFQRSEVMPAVQGDYGTTIWQWDDKQA